MIPQSVSYSADGVCAVFGFSFAVLEASEIEVLLDGIVQAGGYAILGGEGVAPGGAVRFATAPAMGAAVTLRRTGKVQVSGSDAPGFLEAKIVAGSHITVTKTGDSSGEHLSIASTIDPAAFATAAQGAKADSALQPSVIDTDGALAANADGLVPSQKAVKTYVDGKVNAVAADLATDGRNILRQALSSAVHGGYEAEALFGGFCDAFNADTIGANSSGQSYDAAKRLYTNRQGTAAGGGSATWSFYTNSNNTYSWSGDDLTVQINGNAWGVGSAVLAGDFVFGYSLLPANNTAPDPYIANTGFRWGIRVGSAANSSQDIASETYNAGTWWFGHDGVGPDRTITFWNCSNQVGSVVADIAAGDVFAIVRNGSTLSVTRNGILLFAYSGFSSTADIYPCGGSGTSGVASGHAQTYGSTFWNVNIVPTAMTLVSDALSPVPASAPARIRLMILWEAVDAATLGTDFTAEATRDGSTWTAGSLSDTGLAIAGFKLLSAEVDVSGQPSGTSVKYRLKTLNSKVQQVKGVALSAR